MPDATDSFPRRLTMRLNVEPEKLAQIRQVVKAHLDMWRLTEIADLVTLAVTELLTNVHKHTPGKEATLLVQRVPGGACVVVSDPDPTIPKVKEPDWIGESGRGLHLLTTLADDWGIAPTNTGKDVWIRVAAIAHTPE
ncbi:ATP-binding protein [Streptomyces sp. ME19-03-3]|nr:ATP-binding protein [Streptomyces sp. ME19-03-3]